MAGHNSRDLTIDWDSITLVNVQSKQFGINNSYVDVTTDDDAGWRTLLADPGTRSIDVSVSGIANDEAVLADIMAASVSALTMKIDIPSSLTTPGNLTGSFLVTSFEYEGGAPDDAVEFSATFESTGSVTYTASV